MSDSDQEGTKRCCAIYESPIEAKKFKESHNEREEENESSSCELMLSEEELQLAQPFEGHNIILNIGGKKLHMWKEHLVSASPVFDRMLNSQFKEAKQTEIPLPGKDGNFIRFLRYINPGFTDELQGNCSRYLAVGGRISDALKHRIDIFLADFVIEKGDTIRSEEIERNLLEAELYKLPSYLSQCIDVAARKLSHNLMKCEGYQDISKDTRLQIYAMRCSIIDASLSSGTLYNPPKPFSVNCLGSKDRYGWKDFTTKSIHLGWQETDGETLKAYLQNN